MPVTVNPGEIQDLAGNGYIYNVTPPGYSELHATSLLLTTGSLA